MNKVYTYIFCVAFTIIISIPFLGMFFHKTEVNSENRKIITFEEVKGLSQLNKYLLDNHALRELMSECYFSFFTNVLKENPAPQLLVFGKNDWYYLVDNSTSVYDKILGVKTIDEGQLDRSCKVVCDIKKFCDSLGVDFYFVIAPNKESIYPEYLPLQPNHILREKEYFIPHLQKNCSVNLLDLEESLLPEKDSMILYRRNDSHWNGYGGFLATIQILDFIETCSNISISFDESSYEIRKEPLKDMEGDLVNLVKMKTPDEDFSIIRKEPIDIETTIIERTKDTPLIIYTENKDRLEGANAIILRDSFFGNILLPFSHSIYKGTYITFSHFDKQMLLSEIKKQGKTDFILFEVVERHIAFISVVD